jgi:hypothetical protein
LFFTRKSGSASVVFAIGQALKGQLDETCQQIFSARFSRERFLDYVGPAKQAIAFYEAQLKACRKAIDWWTVIGIRFRVVKDVRKLISKLIWDAREEALYHLPEKPIHMSKRAKAFESVLNVRRKW